MERIEVAEAQERIDELLDRVEDGEKFLITLNDEPLACLVPTDHEDTQDNAASNTTDQNLPSESPEGPISTS